MIVTRTPKGWLVILQPDNLARMKAGDPVTIPDLGLMICYEELPQEQLVAKLQGGDPRPYLTRGWQQHPDDFADPVKVGTTEYQKRKHN